MVGTAIKNCENQLRQKLMGLMVLVVITVSVAVGLMHIRRKRFGVVPQFLAGIS